MVSTRSKVKRNKPHIESLDPPPPANIFRTLICALESPVAGISTSREVKCNKPNNETLDPPPPLANIFETLNSAFESPEVFKSQLLRSSYYVLIQLSSDQQIHLGKGADLNEWVMKTNEGEVRVTIRDLCRLSDILFKELQKRLKHLHSSKHDVSASPSLGLEELNLLIRCCMVILTLHLPQEHLLESGRALLLILKKLSLLEIAGGCDENVNRKNSSSCQCMYSGEDSSDSFARVASLSSLELFDPCIPSIRAIFEVIIDELLVHDRLRKYLQLINSLSPMNERLFKHDSSCGEFGMMMEMICSHFSLSVPDEGARTLCRFLDRITRLHAKKFEASKLSVIAARKLLQNPAVITSPKLLQAHIISLVSDAISVGVGCESLRLIDCYLSVFESSVILYTQHMSSLKTEKHSGDDRRSLVHIHDESFQPSFFDSCIEPGKRQKLNHLMKKLNDSWNSNQRSVFVKTKSDLITSSTEYVTKNQYILDLACRDELLSLLNCMLMRAANEVNVIQLPLNGDASLQDICLLASLLMVMSNSLIQALSCLRHCSSDQQSPNTVCKEYDFLMGVISCFREFSIRLPIQQISHKMMTDTHPMKKRRESRLMLLHFLGLLSLSFDSGLDFLVKSCISTIMALTNLFMFEDGNIDALRPLAAQHSIAVYRDEAVVYERSSLLVATQFQKIQALYASKEACVAVASDSTLMEDNVEAENLAPSENETCSGEIFLKSRLKGGSSSVTEIDDLTDFIECKKGKDYDGWLKARCRFREWKFGKQMKRRWEKKKQTWRSMMGRN